MGFLFFILIIAVVIVLFVVVGVLNFATGILRMFFPFLRFGRSRTYSNQGQQQQQQYASPKQDTPESKQKIFFNQSKNEAEDAEYEEIK